MAIHILTSDCMLDLYSGVDLEEDPLVGARVDEELEGTEPSILQMLSHVQCSPKQRFHC